MIELARNFVISLASFRKDWMPKTEPVPAVQITPQRIAKIIMDKRNEAEDIKGAESIFNRTFDIRHVRRELHPEALRDDFHARFPWENQAVRRSLRKLCTEGALSADIDPSSNNKEECVFYRVIDPVKLKRIAEETPTN